MLCENLSDPYGVEHGGEMKGMGLLKSGTVFEKKKLVQELQVFLVKW
jgi:adenosylcobyric acid synthase